MENSYAPRVCFHPGETLREKLNEMDMSVKEISIRSGETEQLLLDLLDGKASVTPLLAVKLEYVTAIPADFWLAKQRNFDLYIMKQALRKAESAQKKWLGILPVDEMVANNWVEARKDAVEMIDALLRFFGVVSTEAWENYYFKQRLKVAFRISLEETINPYALSAWLRRGEIQAQQTWLEAEFSRKKLKEALKGIVLVLRYPESDVMERVRQLLAETGVKLLYTEPLSDVPIKGATRWIYGHPCIQLLKTLDAYENFCHTVLHEIGHIILHGKKDIFLENAGYTPNDPAYARKEAEAESFACKWEAMDLG